MPSGSQNGSRPLPLSGERGERETSLANIMPENILLARTRWSSARVGWSCAGAGGRWGQVGVSPEFDVTGSLSERFGHRADVR